MFTALPLAVVDAQKPVVSTVHAATGTAAVRVFLDCDDYCDFDYLRTETQWVEFVRDRTAADVHVLVTQLGTAAGGDEYTIDFQGQGAFAMLGDTLHFVSPPDQADALVRQGLTNIIQLGLVPYVLRTPGGSRLHVSSLDDESGRAVGGPHSDPWNSWVFSIGLNGSVQREERQQELNAEGSLSATRITPVWKLGISADGEFNRDRYDLEDRVATSRRESYSGGAVAIRSLGPHWGAGAEAVLSSSTFENTQLAMRFAPAVELSVWPYDEATRRQLTLQYSVGISSFDYREETIFGRLQETRPTQSFVAGYDTRQPWGSADAGLEVANFLDDFSQYRLAFDGGIDIRLARGLSLELDATASLIRDQLSIVKRGATEEEVLLELRDLATDYRYDLSFGISYTFGSIFNSIVNPRFGTGPGQILQ